MIALSKTVIPTPVGPMIAMASAKGLFMLMFEEETKMTKYSEYPLCDRFHQTLTITTQWLKDYFSQNFAALKKHPPLDMQGTPFAKAAWKALLRIPTGYTQSYGELAKSIGSPKASRAIGRVMGANPIAIIVPCHRIIGSQGTLTGYAGGLQRKQWLLAHERGRKKDSFITILEQPILTVLRPTI